MKKILSHEEIHRRAKLGAFLNLKQLSIVPGFCYSTVHKWRKEGLSLIDGKIALADALRGTPYTSLKCPHYSCTAKTPLAWCR